MDIYCPKCGSNKTKLETKGFDSKIWSCKSLGCFTEFRFKNISKGFDKPRSDSYVHIPGRDFSFFCPKCGKKTQVEHVIDNSFESVCTKCNIQFEVRDLHFSLGFIIPDAKSKADSHFGPAKQESYFTKLIDYQIRNSKNDDFRDPNSSKFGGGLDDFKGGKL